MQYALEKLGLPVPTQDELEWVIGPPLKSAFARMLGPGGDVDEGVRLYRERYSVTGLFENEVIPGIPELLDNLLNDNRILYVATSKPRVFAQRILDHSSSRAGSSRSTDRSSTGRGRTRRTCSASWSTPRGWTRLPLS